MKSKILIVDDHKILREGLRNLLEKELNVEIVGEAENGLKAVNLARKLRPEVIIMDITLPDMNGIDAAAMIHEEFPTTKVIGLSMHSDRRFVMGMLKSGVSGYVLKESAFNELKIAIEAVIAGRAYVSPSIARTVIDSCIVKESDLPNACTVTLSARERAVIQLIAEGHSTRDIASRLNISHKTVEARRRQIMEKLNTNNIADLIKYALKEGLTSLEF